MVVFDNGEARVTLEQFTFMCFSNSCAEYEQNMAFLKCFPDKPYKSLPYKMKYVANVLWEMKNNGIEINKKLKP